jgi:hypothetical protein
VADGDLPLTKRNFETALTMEAMGQWMIQQARHTPQRPIQHLGRTLGPTSPEP